MIKIFLLSEEEFDLMNEKSKIEVFTFNYPNLENLDKNRVAKEIKELDDICIKKGLSPLKNPNLEELKKIPLYNKKTTSYYNGAAYKYQYVIPYNVNGRKIALEYDEPVKKIFDKNMQRIYKFYVLYKNDKNKIKVKSFRADRTFIIK